MLDALAQRARRVPFDAVVDPLPHFFAFDQSRLTQQAKVVGDRRLLYRYRRLEIADAHATFIPRENVEKLESHRMRELFEVRRQRSSLAIRTGGTGADVAAALSEFAIDDFKCSGHERRLASISTIVNIL